ncbi:hypothetical protein BC835DRAFT_1414122 [Cytidiella melzeri]|nr:hypothetical protein BC835DRAFT_1414122 [Cytidiella melzeri]
MYLAPYFFAAFFSTVSKFVAAQRTEAVCLAGYDWMTNSKGQSPCLVAAFLDSVCNADPASADIEALTTGQHYVLPTTAANDCYCNTVAYSLLGACAFCQGDFNLPWSSWKENCTNSFVAQFPRNIPPTTAIPAWAYYDVSVTDRFNLTVAQALASQDSPDSTASLTPSSTSASKSTSPPSPSNVQQTSPSKKSAVGPIVGGVIGGVGGLAILLTAFAIWAKRHRAARKPASADFPSTAPLGPPVATPWSPDVKEKLLASSVVASEYPFGARLYNPNDPSTFPGAALPGNTQSTTSTSLYDARAQPGGFQPVRYAGLAEL